MHYWEANRILKSPLIDTVTVGITFSKLTTRMKNAVKRGLTNGIVKGGYASESVRLCQVLAEHYEIPFVRSSGGGFNVTAVLTNPIKHELAELVRADLTAYMLEHPTHKYVHRNAQQAIANIMSDRANWISFHEKGLYNQAHALIANQMQGDERNQRVSEACDLIDSGGTLTVPLKGDTPWQ